MLPAVLAGVTLGAAVPGIIRTVLLSGVMLRAVL